MRCHRAELGGPTRLDLAQAGPVFTRAFDHEAFVSTDDVVGALTSKTAWVPSAAGSHSMFLYRDYSGEPRRVAAVKIR